MSGLFKYTLVLVAVIFCILFFHISLPVIIGGIVGLLITYHIISLFSWLIVGTIRLVCNILAIICGYSAKMLLRIGTALVQITY